MSTPSRYYRPPSFDGTVSRKQHYDEGILFTDTQSIDAIVNLFTPNLEQKALLETYYADAIASLLLRQKCAHCGSEFTL